MPCPMLLIWTTPQYPPQRTGRLGRENVAGSGSNGHARNTDSRVPDRQTSHPGRHSIRHSRNCRPHHRCHSAPPHMCEIRTDGPRNRTSSNNGRRGKQQRYPPAGGRRVTTFTAETWGRLGSEAEQVLQQLAAAARRRDQQRDRLTINRIPKWRALIDATNQRSIARRLLGAFLGTDGKPWRPPAYRRDCAYEANTNRLNAGEQMTYPHTGLDPARLQWTDDVRGAEQGDCRPSTISTATADQQPRTQHAPTQIGLSQNRHAHTDTSPVTSHQVTAEASQSTRHADGITPSQTPYGSDLPQGLHAANTHECKQLAGRAIRHATTARLPHRHARGRPQRLRS